MAWIRWVPENENYLFLKINFFIQKIWRISPHTVQVFLVLLAAPHVKLTVIIRKTDPPHMLNLGHRVKCHRTANIKLGRCSLVVFAQIPPTRHRVVVDNYKVAHFLAGSLQQPIFWPLTVYINSVGKQWVTAGGAGSSDGGGGGGGSGGAGGGGGGDCGGGVGGGGDGFQGTTTQAQCCRPIRIYPYSLQMFTA